MRCACGYDDHGTGDSAHFCVVASPVQGAASASGAKGAAVKTWQERYESDPWGPKPLLSVRREAYKDAEIADWRALAERAQAAQPSGAVAKLEIEREFLEEWIHYATEPVGVECCGRGDGYECCMNPEPVTMRPSDWLKAMQERHAAVVSHLAATPAPEQEAAQSSGASFNILPTLTPEQESAAEKGFCPACNAAALKFINRGEGMRFFQCAECKDITVLSDAAPVAQEAEQPQGDVMRPFGAPAGQHDAIAEARARLEAKWDAEGDCGSCGWHAALYEHNVEDSEIAEALEKNGGILELSCVSKDDDDSASHRGVKINIAAPPEQSAASGSREGRDGCTKSGASSTAFDDQYAEDPTGATNTSQPEGEKGGAA